MLMPLAVPDPNRLSPDRLVQVVNSGEKRSIFAVWPKALGSPSPPEARFRQNL
jgi:hypothetical protein